MRFADWLRGIFNRPRSDRENVSSSRVLPVNLSGFRSGVHVDEQSALTLASVWCAVRAISEPLAAMPFHVYQRVTQTRREERRDHPVDWLISMQPNPEQTAFDFWDWVIQRCLCWGNAYAEIERNARGEPAWLWPIEPWRVQLKRNAAGGLEYHVSNGGGPVVVFDPADIYHLHGLGDGYQGYSVVAMARDSLRMSLTMEQFGTEFFTNGARMGAVIKAPAGVNMDRAAVDAMLDEFNKRHGPGKRFTTGYLDRGMDVEYPSIPPEDAQFLQSREFAVIEIARWFRVPPHLLYDLSRATFSNIEHQSLEYVQHTLLPWARRMEKQTDLKLFGRQQRGVFYSRLNFDSMLRGDIKSRFEAYAIAHQNGIYSANDIRELEDMNPAAGGELYVMQSNMIPADQLADKIEADIEFVEAKTEQAAREPTAPTVPNDQTDQVDSTEQDQTQPQRAAARVVEMTKRRRQ